MESTDIEKLKYPIGKYERPQVITRETIDRWIGEIEEFPSILRKQVSGLTEKQLSLHYRPGGWMVRQVIHHLADSHMNSLTRFKLSLTEENPVIKPYKENLWAELPDGKEADINISLLMLEGIHKRWAYLLGRMKPEQFERAYIHPERKSPQKLDGVLGLYAWHCNHHLAHIKQALEKGK
ncbi:MAG TPA: bacillithiol transferase BstA [Cyclobacteriaceae bacterium]|nr:bacillithiol transferase BstA [Cyclobacteriaceae bacterium]